MSEEHRHWADEKEVIKTNKPLKFVLILLKFIPGWLIRFFIFPVSFFFFVFSKNARQAAIEYQKQIREFSKAKGMHKPVPRKLSSYKQIASFAFCVVEKMQGWLGKVNFDRIQYHDDDIDDILNLLKTGKGALLITSHLGNMELLRSLSDYNEQLVGRDVPVYVVMDMKINTNFTETLKSVNPKFSINVINSVDIGPDSIVILMEAVENGALVVIAGDRTSAKEREKNIKVNFLGKPAPFPYGVFLIPFLMKVPVYYMFGMRSRLSLSSPKQNVYIEKSQINFDCPRSERASMIEKCCAEFAGKLEKFCMMYPFQWYNFFNFWDV